MNNTMSFLLQFARPQKLGKNTQSTPSSHNNYWPYKQIHQILPNHQSRNYKKQRGIRPIVSGCIRPTKHIFANFVHPTGQGLKTNCSSSLQL